MSKDDFGIKKNKNSEKMNTSNIMNSTMKTTAKLQFKSNESDSKSVLPIQLFQTNYQIYI